MLRNDFTYCWGHDTICLGEACGPHILDLYLNTLLFPKQKTTESRMSTITSFDILMGTTRGNNTMVNTGKRFDFEQRAVSKKRDFVR